MRVVMDFLVPVAGIFSQCSVSVHRLVTGAILHWLTALHRCCVLDWCCVVGHHSVGSIRLDELYCVVVAAGSGRCRGHRGHRGHWRHGV